MYISNPHIYTHGFYYKCLKRLVRNYCDFYNEGKRSGQQLKSQHRRLIRKLIDYAAMVIEHQRKDFNKDGIAMAYELGTWERINLSRFLEATNMEVHPDTVKRYKKRLIEAGILKASSADFEEHKTAKTRRSDVLINPELLLIYDLDNPDYIPTTQFFSETDLLVLTQSKRAGRIAVSGNRLPQEQSNRIMAVDNFNEKGVPNRDDSPILPEQDLVPDTTTKQTESQVETKQKSEKNAQILPPPSVKTPAPQEPDQSSARAAAENAQNTDSLAEIKLSFARTFYIYLLQRLFFNHNIYDGESQKSIFYLAETYFAPVQSEHHARYLLNRYKYRVDLVANYIKRKNFDFSNIYPYQYLNVKNPKGFTATKAWAELSIGYVKAQKERKQKYEAELQEKKIMQQLMKQYSDKPTTSEVSRALKYLSANMPHLTQQYAQLIEKQR